MKVIELRFLVSCCFLVVQIDKVTVLDPIYIYRIYIYIYKEPKVTEEFGREDLEE